MRPKLVALGIVVVFAYLLTGCAAIQLWKPSICATGEVFDGDECVCKPGHVLDADGKGCHVPEPEPSADPTPTPTPEPTPLPAPEATPTPIPTPRPGACYQGPWDYVCRFPSCEVQGFPDEPIYAGIVGDAIGEVMQRFPLIDGRRIREDQVEDFSMAVRDQLRSWAWCAESNRDNRRVSHDEVAIWQHDSPGEHFDICVAAGAPEGTCYVGTGIANLVARRVKK